MDAISKSDIIRRTLIARLADVMLGGGDIGEIDKIPLEMARGGTDSIRCCLYKDRAVIRARLMALMGYGYDEDDEYTPLSLMAEKALAQEAEKSAEIFTVIHSACDACVKGEYIITDACRGCVARPCTMNCPADAVTFKGNRARINTDRCVSCGKCMKVCPYHAVIYAPKPCEEACPVNAVSVDENGRQRIDGEKCIHCGKCMAQCPFGAVAMRSSLFPFFKAARERKKMVALAAPAFFGQFNASPAQIIGALKHMGFAAVVEVAEGAEQTASEEWKELEVLIEKDGGFMTTSCCPAYVEAVEKHLPELKGRVSHTSTPLTYASHIAEKRYPGMLKVFISPCAAKKAEARKNRSADIVLTFEEAGSLLMSRGIDVTSLQGDDAVAASDAGRRFPVSGGVSEALSIKAGGKSSGVKPVIVNGLDKKTINLLKAYAKGHCPGNIVEVMTCQGGCVGGPASISTPEVATRLLKKNMKGMENIDT